MKTKRKTILKLIAFVLTIALVTGVIPTGLPGTTGTFDAAITVMAADANFQTGDGSAASPFGITTAEELEKLAALVNANNATYNAAYYRLGANIDLSSISNWTPIGTQSNPFKGTFDGNGKTISNMTIDNSSGIFQGLFGKIDGAVIEKLGVTDVALITFNNSGGIAGFVTSSSITNCYTTGSVRGTSYVIGGIAGYVSTNSTISNCYSTCNVTGGSGYAGGIAGQLSSSSVLNCYATGTIRGTVSVGGIVGDTWMGTISNCAALNVRIEGTTSDVGRIIGSVTSATLSNNAAYNGILNQDDENSSWVSNLSGKDGGNLSYTDIIADGTIGGRFVSPVWTMGAGALPGFGAVVAMPSHIVDTDLSAVFEGEGTEASPFIINTEAHLRKLASLVNGGDADYLSACYRLTESITLDCALNGNWTPIGTDSYPFKGTFDGNGKAISNMTIDNSSGDYQGLFGKIDGAVIEKLGVTDVALTTHSKSGGIAGRVTNSSITNCYTTGSVSGTYSNIGGIAGYVETNSTILNCYSTCDVTGGLYYTGGIAGYLSSSSVLNCYATGTISGTESIGGIVGNSSSGTVSNCAALNVKIAGTTSDVGRIIGSVVGATLSNNVAYSEILNQANTKTWSTKGAATNNGLDIKMSQVVTPSFWSATMNWTSPWICGEGKLPVLAGDQDGTIPSHFGRTVLTITGVTATTRSYDGTTTVVLSGGELSGVLPDDEGEVGFTLGIGVMEDKNVGDGKTVTTNILLTGSEAGNYTLTQPTDVVVTIEERPITITDVTATTRSYDGTTTVGLSDGELSGVLSADEGKVGFTLGSGEMDNKKVGDGKTVTTNILLTGSEAGNYTLTQPTDVTVSITERPVTISGLSASDKAYDGTTAAVATGTAVIDGKIDGDDLTVEAGTAAFDSADKGKDKTVTFSGYTLSGDDAGNYELSAQPADVTASIKPDLTIADINAVTRSYDGTTNVTLTGGTLVGVDEGDDVGFNLGIGTMTNKNAGTNKTVTTNITLTGDDSDDYILTQPTDVVVTIEEKSINITDVTATPRTYNGTPTVDLGGGELSGVLPADEGKVGFTLGSGEMDDKNVGDGKTVTTNILLTGSEAGNYTLTQPTDVTVAITERPVTITGLSASSKVHDGTTKASITGTAVINGKIAGDNLTVITGTAAFDNANVGTGKTVTFSGFSLTGTDAGNYTLSAQPASVKANITAKPIVKTNQTITAKNFTKAYGDKAFNLGAKCSVSSTKLTYTSNNKAVCTISSTGKITIKGTGKATITITAPGSEKYNQATKKITIKVSPKKPTLSSVKTPKTKQVAVTWKKDTRATGYEVQISTKSNFKSGNKSKVITKNKTITYTFTKLKKGTTYYGHVRAYKTIDGKKVYGAWSAAKKVKCK